MYIKYKSEFRVSATEFQYISGGEISLTEKNLGDRVVRIQNCGLLFNLALHNSDMHSSQSVTSACQDRNFNPFSTVSQGSISKLRDRRSPHRIGFLGVFDYFVLTKALCRMMGFDRFWRRVFGLELEDRPSL